MPRVNYVKTSRKPLTCGGCRKEIVPPAPYKWAKRRYGPRMVRCALCEFRATDLSSAKTAQIEDAIADARKTIDAATTIDDIREAMESVASSAQEVADEYQEASDNWAGGNGHEEFQTKAEGCSTFADDCSSWEPDEDPDDAEKDAVAEVEREDGEGDDDFENRKIEAAEEERERVLTEARDSAGNVLDSFEVY